MRKILLLLATVPCYVGLAAQQPLQFEPARPMPGQVIHITYNPSGTPMFGVKDFNAVAYLMDVGNLPHAVEIPLKASGTGYTGQFATEAGTQAVSISFYKDDIRDNNNDEGYSTPLYESSGEPVPGSAIALGDAFYNYGYLWGLKRNADKGLALYKEAFSKDNNREQFKLKYLDYLARQKDEESKDQLKKELDRSTGAKDAPENLLSSAYSYYLRTLNDSARANEVRQRIISQYPQGNFVRSEYMMKIFQEKDAGRKSEMAADFEKRFPPDNAADAQGFSIAQNVAVALGEKGDYAAMSKWMDKIKDPMIKAQALNSVAWSLSGESIDKQPRDAAKGAELSKKSLDLVEGLQKHDDNPPVYQTANQRKENLERTWAMYADTYALLLYHQKKYDQAYEYEKKAVEAYDQSYIDMNESYAVFTEKIKGPKAAMAELKNFMEAGKYTPKMKEQYKRLYLADHHTEAEWTAFETRLSEANLARLREELAKKMINEPAKGFALRDLQGNEVSLASLKGKVVVVDFWATWCGPCKASFPGMKMAVDKYKTDKNVQFVFIDTWENGDKDKVKKLVSEFIDKNAYPFYVLMDYDNKTVSDYAVEGIPTKFVIDPNGQVRFKSIGFGGNTEGLFNEMGVMIEMARESGSGTPSKKAF